MATLQEFVDFVAGGALYGTLDIQQPEEASVARMIVELGFRRDLFCPRCDQDSTFVYTPPQSAYGGQMKVGMVSPPQVIGNTLDTLRFACARVTHHSAVFCFNVTNAPSDNPLKPNPTLRVTKIGQFPSHADLEAGRFAEFKGMIDAADLAELKRAAGLASHGIGIGSFVYLRRIFERLLERARAHASSAPGWDQQAYRDARVQDRIRLLRAELPPFIVENASIYAILSLGIHELSEENCMNAYEPVELAITLMLDEIKNAKQREKRLKSASAALQKVHTEVARKGGTDPQGQ